MSGDFNLDQVLKESDDRNAVEELTDKDELVQDDFSDTEELYDRGEGILKDHNACGCTANATSRLSNGFLLSMSRPNPIVFLEDQTQHREVAVLETLNKTHKKYIEAKYELYKVRGEFYCDKANWDKCKEEVGKATDSIFREYARKHLSDLMEARELAEFEYEQALRVFNSL